MRRSPTGETVAEVGGRAGAALDEIGLAAPDGSTVVVPTGVGEPPTILEALSENRTDFRDVKVSQILPLRPFGYLDPETVEHVRHSA